MKYLVILFCAICAIGQAQTMNVHLKDGQTVRYGLSDIDYVDFSESESVADRTVLVYINGENSLNAYIDEELEEMMTGSRQIGDNNLLVYVDRAKSGELPWLGRIYQGELTDVVNLAEMGISNQDEYSTDPKVMEAVMRYAFENYPSKNNDYGLVLWGHASGWLLADSVAYTNVARQRAYGVDSGSNIKRDKGKWINIPTMAKILKKLPRLRFIFADCCNFQCLETAYELKDVAEFIIGSPAEIPGVGAPYDTVVPAMFEQNTFYSSILDRYAEQRAEGLEVPLSVICTAGMEKLAAATSQVLQTIVPAFNGAVPDMEGVIHYYYTYQYFDANDFVRKYAPIADYEQWKQAFNDVVVYRCMASEWMTNVRWDPYYSDFTVTEDRYGGVSMYVPQVSDYWTYANNIKKMGWYRAAGYPEVGW